MFHLNFFIFIVQCIDKLRYVAASFILPWIYIYFGLHSFSAIKSWLFSYKLSFMRPVHTVPAESNLFYKYHYIPHGFFFFFSQCLWIFWVIFFFREYLELNGNDQQGSNPKKQLYQTIDTKHLVNNVWQAQYCTKGLLTHQSYIIKQKIVIPLSPPAPPNPPFHLYLTIYPPCCPVSHIFLIIYSHS